MEVEFFVKGCFLNVSIEADQLVSDIVKASSSRRALVRLTSTRLSAASDAGAESTFTLGAWSTLTKWTLRPVTSWLSLLLSPAF